MISISKTKNNDFPNICLSRQLSLHLIERDLSGVSEEIQCGLAG